VIDDTGLPALLPPHRSPLPRRRQALGWAAATLAVPALTVLLGALREDVHLSTSLLLYLLLVCVVAAIGGLRPALATAVLSALSANWFLTEPYSTLAIDDPDQVIALVVFVAAAGLVSMLVGQAARLAAHAERARAEAEALATVAGRLSSESDPLAAMLAHLRITFRQEGAALFGTEGGSSPRTEAADGPDAPERPDDGEAFEIAPDLVLTIVPGLHSADDRRVLDAFAARLADAREQRELRQAAHEAEARSRADELRTAILRAVSHDLRTPLASIKASATSLLQEDIDWSPGERREFAETIDEEADRLDRLIANLLDMSRIEAGAVEATTRPVGLDEVLATALDDLSRPTDRVVIEVPVETPAAMADAGLLERVLANVIANAIEHSPDDHPIRIGVAELGDRVVVRVVDRGPGVPPDERARIYDAFQRLGDRRPGGVGLGMAVARGFMVAMGGGLEVDGTPGGGLTVSLSLPRAPTPAPAAALTEVLAVEHTR
jgi:two-component system, OmpR family, sensor histidine kinase KdpD